MADSTNDLQGVVVIGASAGGVEALSSLAAGLPADLPYAVMMVLHIPADAPSVLAQIIDRAGPLPATRATDDEPLQASHIYVCAPDRHLLIEDNRVALSRGPTENGYRPAINALFRSAALAFGPRTVGVLMSGVLDDGVLGLAAIKSRGGTTICQDPEEALFPSMPLSARAAGVVDQEAAAMDVGRLLKQLAERAIEERAMEPDRHMELENRIAGSARFAIGLDAHAIGDPSGYTCPDCNGSLQSITEGSFRCRVGHAWTADALLGARDNEIENALWIAIRSLQEKAKLARTLAGKVGPGPMSRRYTTGAEEAESASLVLEQRLSATEPVRRE
jgi:two-component system chemotaxis response regulator CheB